MDGTQQVTVSVLTTGRQGVSQVFLPSPPLNVFAVGWTSHSRARHWCCCQEELSCQLFFFLSLSSREWCDRDRHCLLVQASTSCSHLSVNDDWLTRFLSSPVSYCQWENWKLAYRQFNGVPLMKSCQSFGSIRASLSFFRPCVGDDRWACPSALMKCNILLLEKMSSKVVTPVTQPRDIKTK